jgi:MFS family permease
LSEVVGIPEITTLIVGVALHGLCFGCFIFVAFMVVDEETTKDVKATAQNLFNLVIVGIGIIVGSYVAGIVGEWATFEVMKDGVAVLKEDGTPETAKEWSKLFSVPLYGALACLALMLVFYPAGRKKLADVIDERSPEWPDIGPV